ncbi:MAG: KUP/HAK/KT family potassium transporter [Vulcanimicrobiaceae bacterium]
MAATAQAEHDSSVRPPRALPSGGAFALALAALGVVFGDLGTSPLYTISNCFSTAHAAPTLENALGIVSLLLWALAIVVCLKYVGVLMRIDHDGEGGILALLGLAMPPRPFSGAVRGTWLTAVVVAGAAMLLGDGIITPAISVISAIEGLEVWTPHAGPFVVPLSVAILLGLFALQSRGTQTVGRLFGPAMIVWFVAIAATGIAAIARAPVVLWALDPRHAIHFVTHHGIFGFLVFGAIVLGMTGVEALYADMSHFGRAPIARAWFALVFPSLVLNYVGQAATIVRDPRALAQPFFAMVPAPLVVPLVLLATVATVIASQALISGAFTLVSQAINLGLWPRLSVRHTSAAQRGQVFLPAINLALAAACIVLVITFRSSAALAGAYGLAVSATMLATSIAFGYVALVVRRWPRYLVYPLVALFVLIDGTFVTASLQKLPDGAWIPLAISAVIGIAAWTWLRGRRQIARALASLGVPVAAFLANRRHPERPGTMVFLTPDPGSIPLIGERHQWIRDRAAGERIVLLTISWAARPFVDESERVVIEHPSERVAIVRALFGYMESPTLAAIVGHCRKLGLALDADDASFLSPSVMLTRAAHGAMPAWQRALFDFLYRNGVPLPDQLAIPPDRRVELGVEVGI